MRERNLGEVPKMRELEHDGRTLLLPWFNYCSSSESRSEIEQFNWEKLSKLCITEDKLVVCMSDVCFSLGSLFKPQAAVYV